MLVIFYFAAEETTVTSPTTSREVTTVTPETTPRKDTTVTPATTAREETTVTSATTAREETTVTSTKGEETTSIESPKTGIVWLPSDTNVCYVTQYFI